MCPLSFLNLAIVPTVVFIWHLLPTVRQNRLLSDKIQVFPRISKKLFFGSELCEAYVEGMIGEFVKKTLLKIDGILFFHKWNILLRQIVGQDIF